MTGETSIGLDVGGTRIRAARIDRAGGLSEHIAEPVEASRDGFAEQVTRLVGTLADPTTVGVGIGIPGRVDACSGAILSAGYLDIAGLELRGLVDDRFGLPARIENDATMALIAEAAARPGGTEGLVLMVTVGTGIGGAILRSGSPWSGGGSAGQFGHLVVAEDGPRCKCGRRGCVETFSSGTALNRLLVESGLPAGSISDEVAARTDGDDLAARVLETWARPFLRSLETLSAAFDPRLIVIGGGLGATMFAALKRIESESRWFRLPVEPAILGDRAGVIGAGLRCFLREAE